ncbi:hypothetical protein BpHYR1_008910 [Brachionus plicatilis]|uniref:Uncharacterized protein n=1 Tax=Brachionus plicatilis TaxID=10195 RepID=A0A3M7RL14_BRAPC|nr:hypothetical protein BpHYR1_008910 [Brachionus plicatilis]
MPAKNKTQQEIPKEPEDHLLWKYLAQEDLQAMENMDLAKLEFFLAEKFHLNEYETELKQACFLDYYLTQYWWARKEKSFNLEQVSSFFSIAYNLMENLRDKNFKFVDNLGDFNLMLSVLNERMRLFSDQQLKDMIKHFSVTFFQNTNLYLFVIEEEQNEIVVGKEIEVECPKLPSLPYPAPLDEALPIDLYEKYILKIPDEPDQEEKLRQELENPENIVLSDEVLEQIHDKFEGLGLDEARNIIFQITNELVTELKDEMRTKIRNREAALLNELAKSAKKK